MPAAYSCDRVKGCLKILLLPASTLVCVTVMLSVKYDLYEFGFLCLLFS